MKRKIFIGLLILCFSIIMIQFSVPVLAAQTSGLTNGKIYNLVNKASGKCLNVNFGTDANGTNVTQYTKDGSLEQRFKLVYNSSRDSYKLYTMSSSNGTNRVLDIYRPIQAGANVDIWTPDDNDAQDLIITSRGSGYYSLHPKTNTNLAITSYGTSNGSGSGTSSTSAGNVYVTTYSGSNNQLWSFKQTTTHCYYYVEANTTDRTPTHTYTQQYTKNMGYNYVAHRNENRTNFLTNLSSSEIFVYHGHGNVGLLNLDGNGNITANDISSLAANSLSNVKLVLNYSCYGANSNSSTGSILDAFASRGAKCAVSWTGTTNITHVNEWNRLFFEKVYNESESIVEGYRHADYWIDSVCGTGAAAAMSGHRVERGNNEIHLYK